MDFLFLCLQWSWNFRLWKSWEGQCCAAGNESVGCVHPRGRLPIDLSSKCSILQAQLLSNWPRSPQLQYLPEHGMHHIQVPGHSWDLLCRAQKLRGPRNTLVISVRCRKSREGQRQKAFGYIRQKKKTRLFDYEMLTSEGISKRALFCFLTIRPMSKSFWDHHPSPSWALSTSTLLSSACPFVSHFTEHLLK